MTDAIVIFWTCGDLEEARTIGRSLVEGRLVACVNILSHVESLFSWKGSVETAHEVKVLLKTTQGHYEAVREVIESRAAYEVSEVTYVGLAGGNEAYLQWLTKAVAS